MGDRLCCQEHAYDLNLEIDAIKSVLSVGIEPWTFEQNIGEAVFIPAGCPYQIRNLKSCINVAVDFVSPENVNECIRLAQEYRQLPPTHPNKEDKLEVKKIILHTINNAIMELDRLAD